MKETTFIFCTNNYTFIIANAYLKTKLLIAQQLIIKGRMTCLQSLQNT